MQADALSVARRLLTFALDQQATAQAQVKRAEAQAAMAIEDLQEARQKRAKEEVAKAEEKVAKAKEEVKEAEEKVEKAKEEVKEAKEEMKEAKEEVQEKAAAQLQCHTSSQFFSAKISEISVFTFPRIRMAFSIVSDLSIGLTVSCRWTGMQQALPMNWHQSGSQRLWTLACNSSSSTGP